MNGEARRVAAADRLPGIRRMSIWLMLLWSLLSLGFYPYFWLGLRAKHFNRLHSNAKVKVTPIVFAAVASTVTPFFMEPLPDVPPTLGFAICVAAQLIFWGSLAWFYLQFFNARRAMMDHLAAFDTPEENYSRISALWTFLFVNLYLQFRINWAVTGDEQEPAGKA
ncbi:hypothetical protein [Fundidesulfovibrio terrae]|uniref:hypothetical protein n=1 Tax=Fundidesulfovibrio terrae TaxID=2922866 RepID=UPI001FAF62B2|nr:hypothetical protein [Fundidesulfovibrio terrae]